MKSLAMDYEEGRNLRDTWEIDSTRFVGYLGMGGRANEREEFRLRIGVIISEYEAGGSSLFKLPYSRCLWDMDEEESVSEVGNTMSSREKGRGLPSHSNLTLEK